MASFGAKSIYAVDVGSVYDTNLTNYGDWLSGWWLFYQRFFRWWGPPIRVSPPTFHPPRTPKQSVFGIRDAYLCSCF